MRDRQRDAGDDQDLIGQRVELLGQRGLLDGRRLEHAADVPDLGRHPGRRHQHGARPACDLAVHEGHVDAVPKGSIGSDRIHLLGRRNALTRQCRLVDLEGRRGEDAGVGRHQIAGLDVDDVARHELVHRDLGEIAVPSDLGLDHHHRLERRGARLRLALLVHGHPGVEDGEQDEEDAGVELPRQEEADDARHQEHDLHRIRVLAAELLPRETPSWPSRTHWGRTSRAGHLPRPTSGRHRWRPPVAARPPRASARARRWGTLVSRRS